MQLWQWTFLGAVGAVTIACGVQQVFRPSLLTVMRDEGEGQDGGSAFGRKVRVETMLILMRFSLMCDGFEGRQQKLCADPLL